MTTNGKPKRFKQYKDLDIVGTAEAADILDVERPRIGRWRNQGKMPPPVAELAATPVWHRKQIEALIEGREAGRRNMKKGGNTDA